MRINSVYLSAPKRFAGGSTSPGNTPVQRPHTVDETRLADNQKEGIRLAEKVLRAIFDHQLLEPAGIQSILDYGCGWGGPTYVLNQNFPRARGRIVALDKDGTCKTAIALTGIVPEASVEIADGLTYLSQHKAKFDLITAFRFAPALTPFMDIETLEFLRGVKTALTPSGRLMICTNGGRATILLDTLEKNALPFQQLDENVLRRYSIDTVKHDCSSVIVIKAADLQNNPLDRISGINLFSVPNNN